MANTDIRDFIRKKYGEAAIRKLTEVQRVDVDVIPTGSLALDYAIGAGGFPRGRVTELYGWEGRAKTTLALHGTANAQRMGLEVLYIDTEHALDPEYAKALGVNREGGESARLDGLQGVEGRGLRARVEAGRDQPDGLRRPAAVRHGQEGPVVGLLEDKAEMAAQVTAFLETMQRHHGRSEEALRNAVHGELEKEERGKLIYGRHLADHGILEGYEFRDGALVWGGYRCLQRPINHLNEFIGYYGAVKTALTSALGAPLEDETLWSNDLYQPLPDYWGVAVLIGHLRYTARWETPNGIISLELTGNRHSRLVIEYQSAEYLANRQHT